jgi:hypothetical protein
MSNLEKSYALDIKIRLEDEKLPPAGIATVVDEFDKDGVVYEKNDVKVIAFEVANALPVERRIHFHSTKTASPAMFTSTLARAPAWQRGWLSVQVRIAV